MIPLIDGDILAYEIPFACEYNKEEIPGFDYVYTVLHSRIQGICEAVGASKPPIIFLTGEGNFRDEVAFSKPYKGTRKGEKPFHYENVRAVLRAVYGAEEVVGYEADDAMAITQTANAYICSQQALGDHSFTQTVICSRDKDLRMVPGYHYGWESGKQGEFDLQYIEERGYLEQVIKPRLSKKTGEVEDTWVEVKGGGILFFYAQMLMGDGVDNIPGCKGVGYKKAYELLIDLTEPLEMEQVVWDTYKLKHPDKPLEELTALFMEQAYLLWMVREFNLDGSLKMWEPSIELA